MKKGLILTVLLILLVFTSIFAYGEEAEYPEEIDDIEAIEDTEGLTPTENNMFLDEETIEEEIYYKGEVISVIDNESEDQFFELEQKVEVVITSGPYRGEVHTITNPYREDHYYFNIYLEEGMRVVLLAEEDDGLERVYLHDIARDRGIIYLITIFVLLLFLIGGWHGFKTVITLLFTALVIIKVMIPLLLAGYAPIPIAILSTIIIIIPMLLIVGGINTKSVSAIIGTAIGLLTAGITALFIGNVTALTGLSSEGANMLSVMDKTIDLQGLLFAGIIIGSLGAVTDVSMSVASAIAEIKKNNPNIEVGDLIDSGMSVGRDIMGTMSNTLLLAYVGSAIPLLLLLIGAEMSWIRIINMDLIATEIVRGLTGSIGLLVSIPVTAVVSGLIIDRFNK